MIPRGIAISGEVNRIRNCLVWLGVPPINISTLPSSKAC